MSMSRPSPQWNKKMTRRKMPRVDCLAEASVMILKPNTCSQIEPLNNQSDSTVNRCIPFDVYFFSLLLSHILCVCSIYSPGIRIFLVYNFFLRVLFKHVFFDGAELLVGGWTQTACPYLLF